MYPELLKIGPFTLHSFGLMMALGFLAALLAMRRLARGTHRDSDYLSRLLVWLMVGGLAGSRLAYVLEHWRNEFSGRPLDIFRIDQGGLMFYGGVIGAIVAIFVFAHRRREHPLEILDLAAAVLPLGHAFGRMGCFLNGCCYGRCTQGPLAVRFPAGSFPWHDHLRQGIIASEATHSLPIVPTQLLEMGANLALFALLFAVGLRHPRRGSITGLYLLLYPVIRFIMEIFRGDPRMTLGALSVGQVISLGLFGLGTILLLSLRFSRSDHEQHL